MSAKRGGFTAREADILPLVAEGLMNVEIGEHLFMAVATVRGHVTNILQKTGARNRTHLAAMAVREGWVK